MAREVGCFSGVMAVVAGIILGLAGLTAVGYMWADSKVFSKEPKEVLSEDWNRMDEAALAVKLVPAAVSSKSKKKVRNRVTLTQKETNYIIQRYIVPDLDKTRVSVQLGDTAMVLDFSSKLPNGRFLNGTMRANISGEDGDFDVEVSSLKTGRYQWEQELLPTAAHYLEGMLEMQSFFHNDPWLLTGFEQDGKRVKAELEVGGEKSP